MQLRWANREQYYDKLFSQIGPVFSHEMIRIRTAWDVFALVSDDSKESRTLRKRYLVLVSSLLWLKKGEKWKLFDEATLVSKIERFKQKLWFVWDNNLSLQSLKFHWLFKLLQEVRENYWWECTRETCQRLSWYIWIHSDKKIRDLLRLFWYLIE